MDVDIIVPAMGGSPPSLDYNVWIQLKHTIQNWLLLSSSAHFLSTCIQINNQIFCHVIIILKLIIFYSQSVFGWRAGAAVVIIMDNVGESFTQPQDQDTPLHHQTSSGHWHRNPPNKETGSQRGTVYSFGYMVALLRYLIHISPLLEMLTLAKSLCKILFQLVSTLVSWNCTE